jgi:hypothetical protein
MEGRYAEQMKHNNGRGHPPLPGGTTPEFSQARSRLMALSADLSKEVIRPMQNRRGTAHKPAKRAIGRQFKK